MPPKKKLETRKRTKKCSGLFLAKEIFIRKFQMLESGKILDQILRQIFAFVENEMKDIARKSKERKYRNGRVRDNRNVNEIRKKKKMLLSHEDAL